MALLVLMIAAACLCRGAASYETEEYSGHGEHDHKFNPKLEIIKGPHEGIQVKGYDPKLQYLGQHVEIPEPPIKVIRVTKTVAIKIPVPYPVKIKERVPYPVHINKPYPVPVPQIVKVPHPVQVHHIKHPEPSILSLYGKKEHTAPVWPSKEEAGDYSEGSDYGEGGGDAYDKASHDHGDGGYGQSHGAEQQGFAGSYGQHASDDGAQHGGFDGSFGQHGGFAGSFGQHAAQDGGQHGFAGSFGQHASQDGGQHGGFTGSFGQHGSQEGGGASYGVPQHQSFAAPPSNHLAAAHGSNDYHGSEGGDSYSAQPQQGGYEPESKSYDAAIQDYLQKLNLQAGSADSYQGAGGGLQGSYGAAPDDYRRVHELETAKVDTVSYDH